MEHILKVHNLVKKYKDFELRKISFELPKGYTVALVGSNGAGKTTVLELIMEFIKKDSGLITYFNEENSIENNDIKNRIGYIEDNNYFPVDWKVVHVEKAMTAGFHNFNTDKFYELIKDFNIPTNKTINKMSKGTKMLLMIAAQFSRNTELLILDEPASPLDPVMREKLCDLFRDYIKNGEKTVFFSTHNIADMEYATDYMIAMNNGEIVAKNFVENLKENYFVIRGNSRNVDNIKQYVKDIRINSVGFEGIVKAQDIEIIKGLQDIAYETPSLQQIIIMLLKGEEKNV